MPHLIDRFLFLAIVLLGLASCQKETRQPEFTYIKTNEVAYKETTLNGVTFSASFILENDVDIIEQGFVFGQEASPTLERSIVVLSADLGKSSFSVSLDASLEPDKTYYVRSFIGTRGYVTYGNEVVFMSNGSLPPSIISIEPTSGLWGDTILIVAKRIDNSGFGNAVYFGDYKATILEVTNDTIYVKVPNELDVEISQLGISTYGQLSAKTNEFKIKPIELIGLNKNSGEYPDTILLHGKGFSNIHSKILLGDNEIKATSVSSTEIKFKIPFIDKNKTTTISLKHIGKLHVVSTEFYLNKQSITGISIDSMYAKDTITLYSKNLDLRRAELLPIVNSSICKINKRWRDSLSFVVDLPSVNYMQPQFGLSISIADKTYNTDTLIATYVIPHKNPKILNPTIENVQHGGYLSIKTNGLYGGYTNEKTTLTKNDGTSTIFDQYSIYTNRLWMNETYLPGIYNLQLHSYNRLSNIVKFEIKEPEFSNLSNNIIKRGTVLKIEGNYLSSPKYYKLRQLKNNRLHDNKWYTGLIPMGSNTNSLDFKNYTVEGRGEYQLEVTIGSKTYIHPNKVLVEDYFDFITQTTLSNSIKNNVCFAKDGYLYAFVHESTTLLVTNINYGQTTSVQTNIRTSGNNNIHNQGLEIHPVISNNNIYLLHEGKIKLFNTQTYNWEVSNNPPTELPIESFGTIDNDLLAITSDGSCWRFNGTWMNIGTYNIKGRYIYGKGNYLYVFQTNNILIYSISDFKLIKQTQSPSMTGANFPYTNIFTYKSDIYHTYYSEICQYSTTKNDFIPITPAYYPGKFESSQFFPDVNGDVYYLNGKNLYKFNP